MSRPRALPVQPKPKPRTPAARFLLVLALVLLACAEGTDAQPAAQSSASVWVSLGGETFTLELAADGQTRRRGLSGRTAIPRNGGMLFVYRRMQPLAMVMRDCSVPIDVAFLDAGGRVVSTAEMQPEPPRGERESRAAYERRLRVYRSAGPAQFAIEVSGGRLRELGVAAGTQLVLDAEALVAAAR